MLHSLSNDDNSVSPTVPVDAGLALPCHEELEGNVLCIKSSAKYAKFQHSDFLCRRRVTINEDANVAFENHDFCEEDTRQLWYSSADYAHFKNTHVIQPAKQIIRRDRCQLNATRSKNAHRCILERVHAACAENDCCPEDFILRKNHNFVALKQSLRALGDDEDEMTIEQRLGLEKITSPALRLDQKHRNHNYIDSVLGIQMKISPIKLQCGASEDERILQEASVNVIANAARAISAPSSRFAHILAHAQYLCQ